MTVSQVVTLWVLALVAFTGRSAAQDCFSTPSNPGCENFAYPDGRAETEVDSLCASSPWLVGCEIDKACSSGDMDQDHKYCQKFSILANLCEDVGGNSSECSGYRSLCGSDSIVALCTESGPIPGLLKTSEAVKLVQDTCADHYMIQCDFCTGEGADCSTPLSTVTSMCLDMSGMSMCDDWRRMCQAQPDPASLGKFCEGVEAAAMPEMPGMNESTMAPLPEADGAMSRMNESTSMPDMQAEAAGAGGSCYSDPTQESCRDFQHSAAKTERDIRDICDTPGISMSWMLGCSVERACKDGRMEASSPPCQPFTLLATLCVDMPGMAGCKPADGGYNALCAPGSVVQQCQEHPAIPYMPRTSPTQLNIVAMCNDHAMLGCNECTRATGQACPTPLETLSELCLGMPGMKWCADFDRLCDSERSNDAMYLTEFCTADTGGDYLPPMRMYFHTGITDIVLFTEWIPKNGAEYFGTVVAILAMGIVTQGLRACRAVLESYWAAQEVALQLAHGRRVEAAPSLLGCLLCTEHLPKPAGTGCCGCCSSGGGRAAGAVAEKYEEKGGEDSVVVETGSRESCQLQPGKTGGSLEPAVVPPSQRCYITRSQAVKNLVRSLFTVVTSTLDYFLMLIAMTFNAGLFAAVIMGFTVGTLLFAHVPGAFKFGARRPAGSGAAAGHDTVVRTEAPAPEQPCCCSDL